ncbi:hypothetical protein ACJROX_21890 [Pseudalkalibacillus sp. A8]|uniref:hypothetical protein n=1 Tax=Pseudalkalibacillus sp. A8 TaxID=3382641 RepID=UPI0038B52C34
MIISGQQTGLFEMKVTVNEAEKFAEVLNDLPLAKTTGTNKLYPRPIQSYFGRRLNFHG